MKRNNNQNTYQTFLCDQAFQIFFQYFYSIEWLRSFMTKEKFIAYYEKPNFENDLWCDLHYLIRISLQFYPTASLLSTIMQLLEDRNKNYRRSPFVRSLYLTGTILEASMKNKDIPEIADLFSKVMNVPCTKRPFSKELLTFIRTVRDYDDKTVSSPPTVPKLLTEDMGAFLDSIVTGKLQKEAQHYYEDHYQYLLNLAAPYPVIYEKITNEKSNIMKSLRGVMRTEFCFIPFAIEFLGTEIPEVNWSSITDEKKILTTANGKMRRIALTRVLSYLRGVIFNAIRFIETNLRKNMNIQSLLSDIDIVQQWNNEKMEEIYDEERNNDWVLSLGKVEQARIITLIVTDRFQLLINDIRIATLLDTLPIEFHSHMINIIPRLMNKLAEYFLCFKNHCILAESSAIAFPEQDLLAKIDGYYQEISSIPLTLKYFDERILSFPMFRDYLWSWKQRYLNDILEFLQLSVNNFDSFDPVKHARLSTQMKQVISFDFTDEFNLFREELIRIICNYENEGKENLSKEMIEQTVQLIVYPVAVRSHLHLHSSLTEVLAEKRQILSLLLLDEQISFAENLRCELKKIYPEMDETLLPQINWNQQPILRNFIFNFFEVLSLETTNNKKAKRFLKLMSFLREDILAVYESNQKVSRIIHLDNLIILEDIISYLLTIQADMFVKLVTQIELLNQALLSEDHDFPYISLMRSSSFLQLFNPPPYIQRDFNVLQNEKPIVRYEELLSFLAQNIQKHRNLQPLCVELMRIMSRCMMSSNLTMDSDSNHLFQKILTLLVSLPSVFSYALHSFDMNELNANGLTYCHCLDELLTITLTDCGSFQSLRSILFTQLEFLRAHVCKRDFFNSFVAKWSRAYDDLCFIVKVDQVEQSSLDSFPNIKSKLNHESCSLATGKLLCKLFHLRFIATFDLISDCSWIEDSTQHSIVSDLLNVSVSSNEDKVRAIFSILKQILEYVSILPKDLFRVEGLSRKCKELLNYCHRQELPADLSYLSENYARTVIILGASGLIQVMDSLYPRSYGPTGKLIFEIEPYFQSLQKKTTIFPLPNKSKQTLSGLWGIYRIFQLFEYLTVLSKTRPSHLKTWKLITFEKLAQYLYKNLFSDYLWDILDCLQHCESFLSFGFMKVDEVDILFSQLILLRKNFIYNDQDPFGSTCVAAAKESYVKACASYVEWRSVVELHQQKALDQVKRMKQDDAKEELARLEMIRQLNILFYSLAQTEFLMNNRGREDTTQRFINFQQEKESMLHTQERIYHENESIFFVWC